MKAKKILNWLSYISSMVAIIVFKRPNQWSWEFRELKEHHNQKIKTNDKR